MTDAGQLLAAIRFADSAFPSGSFAFSSGLEGSHRDGLVCDEDDVAAFVAEQLHGRWHHCDRVLLRSAWAADPAAADQLAEASATMSVLREASRRAGAATLATFSAVVGAGAAEVADYRDRVLAGTAPGHLPVVQAVCLRAAGLTLATAETVVIWQVLSGITGAALRLGIIGHLGAQRIATTLTPRLLDVLALRPRTTPAPFTAYADIAAQRRGDGVRLFAS
ncbi:urease accessory protein UreF [Mycolicibacterium vaccae]|uniref:Urease accessory protein UreF n=1 Tax=Mycolicibacterium vaccae ATCC 25954 TaxID=1194972 RepID=K0VFI2_MYCVA|nr:urease accessory UreF family protein [Mycolicibacterium vaccae]ANI40385.1 urease accessory protein UreF [Mycolicibacterium vaccae 95051]EJZ09859.1 urease accessory protein UreF [Mycolicibacterium vaccae ATCC 25954]MCV7060495.1 urease accessory protein UreF [Mycolicibacterium vaccae]